MEANVSYDKQIKPGDDPVIKQEKTLSEEHVIQQPKYINQHKVTNDVSSHNPCNKACINKEIDKLVDDF